MSCLLHMVSCSQSLCNNKRKTMPKTPQSTLGCDVKGQLAFMPPQRGNSSLPGTHQEQTALKRNDPVKSSGRTPTCCQLQFHPGMVAFKNASQIGDLQAACDAILNKIWMNGPPSNASNSPINHSHRLMSQLKSDAACLCSMDDFS
jgi:hypothetical protein